MHLQIGAINVTFIRQGITNNDLISKQSLSDLLTKMNKGIPFDQDIFTQFWQQCQQNSNGKVIALDFINVIWSGTKILQTKIVNSQIQLHTLQSNKQILRQDYHREQDFLTKHQIQKDLTLTTQKIFQLEKQIQQFQTDLQLIFKLFETQHIRLQSRKNNQQQTNVNTCKSDIIMFGLNLFGFLAELMMTFKKKGFFNLLVYTLVLNYYLKENPSGKYWLYVFCLVILSVGTDLLWIRMYGEYLWAGFFHSSSSIGLEKYTLILTFGLIVNKVLITIILYFNYRPTYFLEKSEAAQEQQQQV